KKILRPRLLMESKKDPQSMINQYLRDITLNFIMARKSTLANTLTVCKHPFNQEKIAQEVKEVAEVRKLEFLRSILSLFLHFHWLHNKFTRLIPNTEWEGFNRCLPDGFRAMKGDGMNMACATGRMTYIGGDDTEEFHPDRWLDNGDFRPECDATFLLYHLAGPRI
ncbi:LOW QUALITY PROTEIN: hypothetical protein CFOL_v3_05377, partial [Cephalotus follicularis]